MGTSTIAPAFAVNDTSMFVPSDPRSTCTSPVRTHSTPSVLSSGHVRSCSGALAPSETSKWAIPSAMVESEAPSASRKLEHAFDDRVHDGMDLAGERGDLELALDERAE